MNPAALTEHSHGTGSARIRDPFPAQSPCPSQPAGTGAETPKGNDTAAMGRPFRGCPPQQGDLPHLPNACQKIHLPKHVRHDAWQLLASIGKKVSQKAAGHACAVIFRTCGRSGTPTPENNVVEDIKTGFGRKNLPAVARMACWRKRVLGRCRSLKNRDRRYDVVPVGEIAGRYVPDSRLAGCGLAAWLLFTWAYCGMSAGLEAAKWQR